MKKLLARMENADRRFDAALLLGIFGLGLVLRLFFIALVRSDPTAGVDDPHYYAIIARNLVEGRGYVELKAHAYRPPGYPFFLATIYSLTGIHILAAQLGLAICGALHGVFLALWVRLLSARRVGYLAGFLAAVHPQFIRYPQTMYSEALYFCLLSLAIYLLLRAMHGASVWNFAVAGIACGLAALTREGTLLMPILVGLWFYLLRTKTAQSSSSHWQQVGRGRAWLVFTLATALTVLPWTYRNYRVLHAFVPVSTNPGINFYIGNNPQANGMLQWKTAPGVKWNEGAGELQAHRRGLQEGVRYAKLHPARTVNLWAKKTVMLWAPPVSGFGGLSLPLKAMRALWLVFYVAAWGFAIYGWIAGRALQRALLLPLILLVGFSIPFILTYVDTRYRLPMESFLLFYTALGLEAWLQCRNGGKVSLLHRRLKTSAT